MSIPLPSRSQMLGGLAGIMAWGVVTGLQAYGLMPVAASAAPAILNVLQAIGLLQTAVIPDGADPVSVLVALVTKMIVGRVLLKYWPSTAEVDMMIKSVAKALPTSDPDYDIQKNGVRGQPVISQGTSNTNINGGR